MTTRVIGVDPGPVPGIVVLDVWETKVIGRVEALQCTHTVAHEVLEVLLLGHNDRVLVQVERFVTRGRANKAQSITRDLVGAIKQAVTFHDRSMGGGAVSVVERTASQVKAWATDERLEEADLLEACKGMRHARDAARHALFAAVHHAGLPDPLSKEWRS